MITLDGIGKPWKQPWNRFKGLRILPCILFAEVDGETVGFLPGIPNLNEIFIDVNGLRYPWNYLQLMWLMKTRKPTCLTAKSVLVLPEYWNTGCCQFC